MIQVENGLLCEYFQKNEGTFKLTTFKRHSTSSSKPPFLRFHVGFEGCIIILINIMGI